MNLAIVTNILTPYRIPLFEAMRKRVDRLHVLLMAEREENREWQLEAVPFECEVLPGVHLRPPAAEVSLHINYGTMRALRRINPDVVLSGGFAPANVSAWLYCRLKRRPFIGWGELSMQDVTRASILRRGLRHLMTTWSEGSIASSGDARAAFAHYGAAPDSILATVMPIDVEYFHARAMACRSSSSVASERAPYTAPILLSVGRLAERKGYRELFAIYAEVLRHRPQASLLIVGDGPQRAHYEAHVRSQGWAGVHFLGFCQANEVARFLALADVFVFHTLYDPFGAVLSEAMAAQLPVVSSIHAAATQDLVNDGITGFRIDPCDTATSAQTLLKVLSLQPQERSALVAAAYLRVRRFDIDSVAQSMVAFMTSAAMRGSRGFRPSPQQR